jgi:class 3 adenylate cyclase
MADPSRRDTASPGTEVIDRVGARIVKEMALLGFPLGASLAIYYAIWGELTGSPSRIAAVGSNLVSFAGFSAISWIAGGRYLRHRLRRASAWIIEARPPRAEDARALAALPLRLARATALAFVTLALGISVVNFIFGDSYMEPVRVFAGLSLMGLIFAALVYLVSERELRPLFRESFTTEGATVGVGIRSRVLLGWALGSGIPLVFILAIPLQGRSPDRLPIIVPMLFMAGMGLFAGVTTMVVVARSIADPLRELQSALGRVGRGDLDTSVHVEDPGEIGLLQRGVNHMVDGLRERRAIEDLFGRHVGEDVARRALETGVELGGELRQVAVLFVDIAGSTALSEESDPQEVVALLNGFFGEVVAAVQSEGGWVNKFEGDAALCIFGAPVSQADAAGAALRAARKLRSSLDRFPVVTGIGVSFGEAVAGNVGAEDRYEYTVIGSVVNEAARLTEYAKDVPEHLVVDLRVVDAAPHEASHWRTAGDLELRGVGRPVSVAVPRE